MIKHPSRKGGRIGGGGGGGYSPPPPLPNTITGGVQPLLRNLTVKGRHRNYYSCQVVLLATLAH